jgi:hypothetical protein
MEQKLVQNKRKRLFCGIGVLVELIVLLICLTGMFTASGRFSQKFENDTLPVGDNRISLERGSYQVIMDYDLTVDAVRITPLYEASYGPDDAETILLTKEFQEKTFELLLPDQVNEFSFQLPELENADDLVIHSITMERTNQSERVRFFVVLCIFCAVDVLFYLGRKGRFGAWSVEKRGSVLCIGLIVLFACVPLMTNYLLSGQDLTFHLMRIEGLAEGLKRGQFPVKMQPVWLNDYGYPVSIMYGDLFLYVPAVLRIIGFSLQASYKIYLVMIQIITAINTYLCCKEIAEDRKLGVVGCFLYVFATNRMTNIYYRAAVGEYTALAFLPLVFLGLFYLLGEKERTKAEQKKVFFLLVMGYTFMLESHMLSFNIAIVFSIIYCLFHFKKFLQNFWFLVKTALITIGLNLGFLVPMADYMISHDMKVKYASQIENMQEHGLFLSQLFQMFRFPVSLSGNVMNGVGGDMAIGIGLAYMLMLALFVWELCCCFWRKKKGLANEGMIQTEPVRIFVIFLLCLVMSCYFFPWHAISKIPVLGSILTPYQFAWRFIGIATFLGVILTMYALKALEKLTDRTIKVAAIVVLGTLTLIGSQYLMDNKVSDSTARTKVTSSASIYTAGAVANGEYLFVENSAMAIIDQQPVPADETAVSITSYEKKNSRISMECENLTDEVQQVKVSFLDYKGFVATDKTTGEKLDTTCDEQHILTVLLPAGYQGTVQVCFRQPWYWRVAEIVSLAVLIALFVYGWKGYRYEKRELA